MKICILGVGRSGTTALYSMLQKILTDIYPGDVDFVYEPFLWDRNIFNILYEDVSDRFQYVNSVYTDGIYHHQKLPLFITDPNKYLNNNFVQSLFIPENHKKHLLIKFIRANGRLPLLNEVAKDCKFIFTIRNPLDVINSVITKFSFFGGEFHKDDFPKFVNEVNSIHDINLSENDINSHIERSALYWYYMNKFALDYTNTMDYKQILISNEQLGSNPENIVSRLCNFLNIEYKEHYIDYSVKKIDGITNNININKDDFGFILEYNKKYLEFLKFYHIEYPEDLETKLMNKYSKDHMPPETISKYIFYGRGPLYLSATNYKKNKILDQKNAMIQQKNTILQEKNAVIIKSNNTVQEKKDMIQKQKKIIQEKNSVIQQRNKAVQEKKDMIQKQKKIMQEKENEINEILNSRTYRLGNILAAPYRGIRKILGK